MKLSYFANNLRRLPKTKPIEIRPITILLGRNSVGKSTFLRSFPLLRQSIETKSSAPVLWYGDYVDFGDFKSAVKNKNEEQIIEFSFDIKDFVYSRVADRYYYREYYSYPLRREDVEVDHVVVKFGVGQFNENTKLAYICVELPADETSLKIDFCREGHIEIFGILKQHPLADMFADFEFIRPSGALFSELELIEKRKEVKKNSRSISDHTIAILSMMKQELSKVVSDRRTSDTTIRSEAIRILRYSVLDDAALKALSQAGTKVFSKFYEGLLQGRNSRVLEFLRSACNLNNLLTVLNAANNRLSHFFKAVEYIGPARARSERYYRRQELEVSDISADGRNLPMFLASLSDRNRKNFSEWVERAFGYGIDVQKTEGHISINLRQGDQSINVVDTGYGVSQVLPVLAQIWWMEIARGRRIPKLPGQMQTIRTLVIEQPELHLHPAHQALLADVFAESVSHRGPGDNASRQLFLVETHSEALVNRLGELIEAEKLRADQVQVVIFNEPDTETDGYISIAEYDQSGVLTNWPFGFFNYSV